MVTPNNNCKQEELSINRILIWYYILISEEKKITIQGTNDSIMINESIWMSDDGDPKCSEDNPLE